MKKLVLLALLVLLVSTNQAQTNIYHPFPTSNTEWNVMFSGYQPPQCYDRKYFIAGDTVVNSLTYHKIKYYGWQGSGNTNGYCDYWNFNGTENYAGAFREDLVQKKVYFLLPTSTTDTLLYDFTLNVGDTIPPGINNSLSPQQMVINSIDSVLIGGNYRKRFNIAVTIGVSIIEGIGSTSGLLEDIFIFEWGGNLYCYSENNQEIYPSNSGSPCQLSTNVAELVNVNNLFIYPNPAGDKIHLNSSEQDLKVQIYNIVGEVVLQKQLDKNEVDIHSLTSGVYIISVSGSNWSQQNRLIKK